jgi:capsular polysaccharide export protein
MTIVALCERLSHYHFFRRLVPASVESGHQVLFLSHRLSVVMAAKRDGHKCVMVRGERLSTLPQVFDELEFYEFSANILSEHEILLGLGCIAGFFDSFSKRFSVDCFFFWNGSSFLARAVSALARHHGFKTLYFELGNFPGKLLVDPKGVNAKSWFAHHYPQLTSGGYDKARFENWRSSYLSEKFCSHRVQQTRMSTQFNWYYPLDLVGFYLLCAPWSERPDVFRRTWRYLCSQKVRYQYDLFSPEKDPEYIFFPLQVSSDSQLLLNSDVDNTQALLLAAEIAKKEGKRLVVKPHPAEGNRVFVAELADLRKRLGFLFVDMNTFQLMEFSSKIVTINSTAGMEAMLLQKPVTVLGRAVYENFTQYDLAFYIQKYLLDIDYFSENNLTTFQIEKIFDRLNFRI